MRYYGKQLFQIDAEIFYHSLTAHQLAVYNYLVFCSGSRNACQMNVRTIAAALRLFGVQCQKSFARFAGTGIH